MMFTPDLKPAICSLCSRALSKPLEILGCSHVYHASCWSLYESGHHGVQAGCPLCDYKVRPKASMSAMVQTAIDVPGAQLPARPARPEPVLGKRSRADEERDIIEGMSRMRLEKRPVVPRQERAYTAKRAPESRPSDEPRHSTRKRAPGEQE